MYFLEGEGIHTPRSPGSKRPLKRRGLACQLIQAAILICFVLTAFLYGRTRMPLPTHYKLDDSDMSLIESICSNPYPGSVVELPKQQDRGVDLGLHHILGSSGNAFDDDQGSCGSSPPQREYSVAEHLRPPKLPDTHIPDSLWQTHPVRGVLYMLVRNEDIQEARAAIRGIEDRFNHRYKYPWVLLNNQDFSEDFQKYVSMLTDAPLFFGKIDSEAWDYPRWIDVPRVERFMQHMMSNGVFMGGSLSYRQMLRYQAGLFHYHPLFRNVDYVWRVEPGSSYSCDMDYDPFLEMKEKNKTLGFTITMKEAPETITNLWAAVQLYVNTFPNTVLPRNETILPWITTEENVYNMCHMWSNFEIIHLDFLRSKAYQDYFAHLDRMGGFFYERWGDAPIRTIAAALFLKSSQVHFFSKIGYTHSVATHCPVSEEEYQKCSCIKENNYDNHEGSCTMDLLRIISQNQDNSTISSSSQHVAASETSTAEKENNEDNENGMFSDTAF